jgi:hypothetical protein
MRISHSAPRAHVSVQAKSKKQSELPAGFAAAFKKAYDKQDVRAAHLKEIDPSKLPPAAKKVWDREYHDFKQADDPGENLKPNAMRGTFQGKTVFAVEHAQTTTGDGNATFFTVSGKVFARQVSTEYDGASWI